MLTQAEIDALLSGALEIQQPDSEESVNLAELMGHAPAEQPIRPDQKKITPYNFWSPDRFNKDQIRAIELIHEDLTERLTASLPSFLRTNVRPRVVHSEQGRFHDFLKDLPENILFHIINLAPLPSQIVLTISPDVSYVILEQRLGGRAEPTQKKRTLTEIDQSLLRSMVEHMLNDIKATWSKVVAIEPNLEDSTVNQHWVQMLIGNERVLLIIIEMTIEGVSGTMNIYIPYSLLKPIVHLLNPHVWISGRKEKTSDPEARFTTYQSLSNVPLPIRVILGNAKISIKELMNLQEGDIIKLETSIEQDLPVSVSGNTCFRAKVGKINNRIAIQITKVLNNSSFTNPIPPWLR